MIVELCDGFTLTLFVQCPTKTLYSCGFVDILCKALVFDTMPTCNFALEGFKGAVKLKFTNCISGDLLSRIFCTLRAKRFEMKEASNRGHTKTKNLKGHASEGLRETN